jgi:hypothetical protein
MSDVVEMSVEDRVKRILAAAPSAMTSDSWVIPLTVALAHGGNSFTRRCEVLADDIAGLEETRAAIRQQYAAVREELDRELANLASAVADL